MIQSENKPYDMSQLDWLWSNYRLFNVHNYFSEDASSRVILTERAIKDLLEANGITSLEVDTKVFDNITEDDIESYLPTQVDGENYDAVLNPITLGENYTVLSINGKNYYMNTSKYQVQLSEDEDNITTKDSNGELFTAITWNAVD